MNSLEYLFVFFVLVPHTISLGRCDDISFSICWMRKGNVLERKNGNIWLNDTSLKSIRKGDKVTSLTVFPVVQNKLTLQYGGSVQTWSLTISPRTKYTEVRGRQKPLEHPTNTTKGLLKLLSPTEVFACESGTLFFHQDENFFLAVGHTKRLPFKLESRNPSMLLVSWVENHPNVILSHTVTLYHIELDSYNTFSMDTTTRNHYRFTALDSCSPYVACVEMEKTHSFTCLSTITDPDIPQDFEVVSWNSSSISLAWDCPINRKYSSFLLTTFYLNGTDHITEEVAVWLKEDSFAFSLSDLPPCTRVKFGLQTVCQAGVEPRYSKMVPNDGNSFYSSIKNLYQTSSGRDNYTLSWEVRNTSSISMFRVYQEGVLHGTTLTTDYTVGGLLPCRKYQAKVEAMCGDGVLMDAKTVTAHIGPRGVSELRYRANDSTAMWTPSNPQRSALAFLYELSLDNGPTIKSDRVTSSELLLLGLEEGKTYILDVWEECDGQWESEHTHLCFKGANSSLEFDVRARGTAHDLELLLESIGLTMIVPWSLPDSLRDDMSEPGAKMKEIFKDKMQELLKDFDQPVRIELETFVPTDVPDKTEVLFTSFDASNAEEDVALSIEDQLDYISSLKHNNITVRDRVIYWDGPDLCASKETVCPRNSMCINTLGSYSCICHHGFYDVSSVMEPPAASHPICKEPGAVFQFSTGDKGGCEKGLFSQCLDKLMTGGIAKPYLTSHIGGKVEVKLNNGWCTVNENDMMYYFRSPRKSSECGTEKQVNKTHIKFQNTLTVSLSKEQTISRRDLKVVWKCVYPRHYVRNAQVSVDMEWLSSITLVEFNSSLQLGLTMSLYRDESYTYSYKDAITLGFEDTLFFQVALQTNSSFVSNMLLQVESCWATESTNAQDAIKGDLLQDGCPVDNTFHWRSVNGLAPTSRFSIEMFNMPKGLPLYFHCLINICGHHEECTKNCTNLQRTKRSESQTDGKAKQSAVVSAGPLVVNTRVKSIRPSYWAEHMTMIFIVASTIGFLGITVLSVSATKAIMTYYEQLRLQ